MHAALEGRLVVDDGHVGSGLERDVARVAAAEVETVEVRQRPEVSDGFLDALVPLLRTDALARGVAELLVEGLALSKLYVRDLEMRQQVTVEIEPGPEPRAERGHDLEPPAADRAKAL